MNLNFSQYTNDELDRLVAEHVIGWEDIREVMWTKDGKEFATGKYHGRPPDSYIRKDIPRYTSDSDIWNLIRVLSQSWMLSINLDIMPDNSGVVVLNHTEDNLHHSFSSDTEESSIVPEERSIPRAVCIAALKFVYDIRDADNDQEVRTYVSELLEVPLHLSGTLLQSTSPNEGQANELA